MRRRPPRSTLFPSRPLSRSIVTAAGVAFGAVALAQPKEKVIRVTARKFVFLPREIPLKKSVPDLARQEHELASRDADELFLRLDLKSTRLYSNHANISYVVF